MPGVVVRCALRGRHVEADFHQLFGQRSCCAASLGVRADVETAQDLLSPRSALAASDHAFLQGLRELGYVEGNNILIEFRFADGRFDRLPSLAAELVQLNVDVIVAAVTQASLAAKASTKTIPIVMLAVGDPVRSGLVTNIARPDGNVTGTSSMYSEVKIRAMRSFRSNSCRGSKSAEATDPPLERTTVKQYQQHLRLHIGAVPGSHQAFQAYRPSHPQFL
jgi:hypothetical protein